LAIEHDAGGIPAAEKDIGEFATRGPVSAWPWAPAAYALRLDADFGQFPRGTAFLVDPEQAPGSGDWAVVEFLDGRRHLVIVRFGPGESLRLFPARPGATKDIQVERSTVRGLHKVLVILFPDREFNAAAKRTNRQSEKGPQNAR
jgi:hypothetical protein